MKCLFFSWLISLVVILAGCKDIGGPEETVVQTSDSLGNSSVVVTVNGQPIDETEIGVFETEFALQGGTKKLPRAKVIAELVNRELLRQVADEQNLADLPNIKAKLRAARRLVLSDAAIDVFLDDAQVSDADIKNEYDARVEAGSRLEIKARHILVKTEDKAAELIIELHNEGDFSKLAKSNSIGPSAVKGGSLGWFNPKKMVKPFAEAVSVLENGKFSEKPVKSRYGWHVILREDQREVAPPSLEKSKDRLAATLRRRMLKNYVLGLKQKAKIEMPKKESGKI